MTWLGAPLLFLVELFFAVHVRSFAAKKSCFGNAWDIEIIQHLSSHPITFLQSINFAPCSSIWGLWLHSETLSFAFDPKLGNAAERGALLTLHDVRILWNFHISESYFSFNMSKMDQFQRTPFNIRKQSNAFFASVAEKSSRLFWWLFNVFSVIRSCCVSINLDRNSYFSHTFFRLLWTFFIVGGFHSYKRTFIICAVGCLNEWFEAAFRL